MAAGLSDLGFEVDVAPLFSSAERVFQISQAKDYHFIACSSLVGAHSTLVPALLNLLKNHKDKKYIFILGGIIPQKDHSSLKDSGVDIIFLPGSSILKSAHALLKLYQEKFSSLSESMQKTKVS